MDYYYCCYYYFVHQTRFPLVHLVLIEFFEQEISRNSLGHQWYIMQGEWMISFNALHTGPRHAHSPPRILTCINVKP